jgi:DNA-3-methyladenine glycosylase
VGKAFGFHTSQCGLQLNSEELFIADDGFKISKTMIGTSPRIGVGYAGKHAELHYRFFVKGSTYVSGGR